MKGLRLVAEGPEHLRALLESEEAFGERFGLGLAPGIRDFMVGDDLSPEFLATLAGATEVDPWTFGFAVVLEDENLVIGIAGFKGPPAEGLVEIAYGIAPDFKGQGYGTTVAGMVVAYATENADLRLIRAHTLPEENASTRVPENNGFCKRGPVEDPEDGMVWRWELELV